MNLLSNVGKGLIKWTPKIAEATADDIAEFGPQAARVRALLNFIPGMSEDAAKISGSSYGTPKAAELYPARTAAWDVVDSASNRSAELTSAWNAAGDTARVSALDAASAEVVSDLITPQVYRTLTNPLASARALDRLAGRAPESFVPIARGMGDRGLVTAPADIVTALRISKLPPSVQPLVMNLVDSGMPIEDAVAAARALS